MMQREIAERQGAPFSPVRDKTRRAGVGGSRAPAGTEEVVRRGARGPVTPACPSAAGAERWPTRHQRCWRDWLRFPMQGHIPSQADLPGDAASVCSLDLLLDYVMYF